MTSIGGGFDPSDAYQAAAASQAQSSARSAQESMRHLEQRLERLTLVCEAMWSLLQEHTQLSEQDLLHRLDEMQQKHSQSNQTEPANSNEQRPACDNCGRTLNPRHDKCLYCGTPRPADSAFDLVR